MTTMTKTPYAVGGVDTRTWCVPNEGRPPKNRNDRDGSKAMISAIKADAEVARAAADPAKSGSSTPARTGAPVGITTPTW